MRCYVCGSGEPMEMHRCGGPKKASEAKSDVESIMESIAGHIVAMKTLIESERAAHETTKRDLRSITAHATALMKDKRDLETERSDMTEALGLALAARDEAVAAREATKRELAEEKGAYDKLRGEIERLKRHQFSASMAAAMLDLRAAVQADAGLLSHEVVRKAIAEVGRLRSDLAKEVERLKVELKRATTVEQPQSEPAKHGPEHGDEPHMCDASCRAARGAGPAKGVEDLLWVGENGSLRTAPGCSYTAAWAHSISQEHNVAVRTAFARGQASRANDGRLRAFEEAWRLVVTEGKTGYDESEADLEKAQEILAAELAKNGAQPVPKRYVVKVGEARTPVPQEIHEKGWQWRPVTDDTAGAKWNALPRREDVEHAEQALRAIVQDGDERLTWARSRGFDMETIRGLLADLEREEISFAFFVEQLRVLAFAAHEKACQAEAAELRELRAYRRAFDRIGTMAHVWARPSGFDDGRTQSVRMWTGDILAEELAKGGG